MVYYLMACIMFSDLATGKGVLMGGRCSGVGGWQRVVLGHHLLDIFIRGVRILGQHLHRLPERLPRVAGVLRAACNAMIT